MSADIYSSHDVVKTTLAVLFIGVFITASFWILRPILPSMAWAAMLVTATWPFLLWLQQRLGGSRTIAVIVMVVLILLIVIVPVSLAVLAIMEKIDVVALRAKELAAVGPPPPPECVGRIPLVGHRIADAWIQLTTLSRDALVAQLTPYARRAAGWFLTHAGSFAILIFQFILTLLISAILYAKGENVSSGVLSFARRLAGRHGEEAAVLAAKSVQGVAFGIVVTAVIQSSIGGIGFVVTGMPVAAFLTAVLFMLCLAQIPGLLLIPAVIWLYWTRGGLWGTILLIVAVAILVVKNLIRPVLIRKGANLSLILIIPGVVGGLVAFGIIGLFIGPVVLAVTYALLKVWVMQNHNSETLRGHDGESVVGDN